MKKIVCYGDSNTWGYDPRSWFGERYDHIWPELLGEKTGWEVVNLGENGREIPSYGETFPPDTDLLIILLGTNDLLQGKTAEAAARKMAAFLDMLSLPPERILLIAPPPVTLGAWVPEGRLVEHSKEVSSAYQTLADCRGIRFVDAGEWGVGIAFDGVHFTEAGHEAFAAELIKRLKSME